MAKTVERFVDYRNKLFSDVASSVGTDFLNPAGIIDTNKYPAGSTLEAPLTLLDTSDADADENKTLLVCSLIICNVTNQTISFNLRKQEILNITVVETINGVDKNVEFGPFTNDAFLVNDFAIPAFRTVDIVSQFNLNLFLTANAGLDIEELVDNLGEKPDMPDMPANTRVTAASVTNQLQCWSGGTTQVFDCTVTFMAVADTSVTIPA